MSFKLFKSNKNRIAFSAIHPHAMRSQNHNFNKGLSLRQQSAGLLHKNNKPIKMSIHIKKKGVPLTSGNTGSMGRLQKTKALAAINSKCDSCK